MPARSPEIRVASSKLGGLSKSRRPDDPDVAEAHRDLAAAKIAEYIRRTVEAAPPLTAGQRSKLAVLLLAGPAT